MVVGSGGGSKAVEKEQALEVAEVLEEEAHFGDVRTLERR